MGFNGLVARNVRRRRLVLGALAVLAMLVAACGRSGFQYIENDADTVFVKIPAEWELLSEGIVDFTVTTEDGQLELLPGDETLPWRAVFDASPPALRGQLQHVAGSVEVQPVDRRLRSGLNLSRFLGFDPTDPDNEVEVLRQYGVSEGGFHGLRIVYRPSLETAVEATVDRVLLTDDRGSAVYDLLVFCSVACYDENAEVIDEIMTTFTVVR